MKRSDPEAIRWRGNPELPAPAADIVNVLGKLVTEERMARMNEVIAKRTRTLVPVLENLLDPHNGAAVLRSADAFGCHEVHVIENEIPFMITHRISRGTHRWLELIRHRSTETCMNALISSGYKVYIAAMNGTVSPEELAQVPKAAVVFGNEHKGVSEAVRRVAHGTYQIPMEGFVESLNVSVASAITLYVASRGRHGNLSEDEQMEIRARYLLALVKDAEDILERGLGQLP